VLEKLLTSHDWHANGHKLNLDPVAAVGMAKLYY